MSTHILLVNENDEIVGEKERTEKMPTDIYRVSALLMYNNSGEVLLAQRSRNKKSGALQWGPSVAGTVEVGETYLSNIVKETGEELGVYLPEYAFTELTKQRFTSPRNDYFCQWYSTEYDTPADFFAIQHEEVEAVRWVHPREVKTWFERNPEQFISSAAQWIALLSKK